MRVVRESLRSLQQEHEVTKDRLQQGIEENELLTAKLRELQRNATTQDKVIIDFFHWLLSLCVSSVGYWLCDIQLYC